MIDVSFPPSSSSITNIKYKTFANSKWDNFDKRGRNVLYRTKKKNMSIYLKTQTHSSGTRHRLIFSRQTVRYGYELSGCSRQQKWTRRLILIMVISFVLNKHYGSMRMASHSPLKEPNACGMYIWCSFLEHME